MKMAGREGGREGGWVGAAEGDHGGGGREREGIGLLAEGWHGCGLLILGLAIATP